ncbi:MAG: hypothetical protein RJB65_726 [Actinomycetota bacterium]|jgi:ferredoxin
MRVWIDQDLCTGDGLCVDHCHQVFTLLDDGIAYVVEAGHVLNDPGGSGSLATVDDRYHQSVVDAALACPGECIFIEVAQAAPAAEGHVLDAGVDDGEGIVTMPVVEIPRAPREQ